MVMTKRVHNETSSGRSSERSLSKTGFCADNSGDSNEDELREGEEERDRVTHGTGVVGVVLSKLRVRVDRRVGISFWECKTDCSAFGERLQVGVCGGGGDWTSSKVLFPCR